MWREDPSFPLFTLRRYLELPEESSPAAMHNRAAKRREELTVETERRLAAEPEKLETFRAWQTSGQQRTVLLEDHNFYIDQKSHVAARIPCLAIGRRLAEQGAIDSPDDVFYLTEQDMQNAALDQSARLQAAVAERRAERACWMHTLPPATIGEGAVDPSLAMTRFFGPTGEEPAQDGVIKGIAASAGVVRGTARVIRTLDEVERLGAGEILVAYATAPPWTPLFAVASAVVTDTGGMLSHCAVVAREYGLPAVVGTKVATQRIEDGMLITVDGGNGTVHIER
jgi:phosphohistidine swiveling domain-containing protein